MDFGSGEPRRGPGAGGQQPRSVRGRGRWEAIGLAGDPGVPPVPLQPCRLFPRPARDTGAAFRSPSPPKFLCRPPSL